MSLRLSFLGVTGFLRATLLAVAFTASFVGGATAVDAVSCNCHCAAIVLDGVRAAASCEACPATCRAYCGQPEALPASHTCTQADPVSTTPTPPSVDTAAPVGTCTFNCTPQVELPCTSDSECQTQCNTLCPSRYVEGSTCSTSPAPSCDPVRRTCRFNCAVTPPTSCNTGPAGDSQCGSRCSQVCTGRTAPAGQDNIAVLCASNIQPRCEAPTPPSTTTPPGSNGSTQTQGESASGASYALENPISGANTIPEVIGKAIKALMGVVGAIALFMFVFGGIRWILAAGDAKAIGEASEILKNASIGLLIIFLSYTIITIGMGLVNELASRGAPEGTGTRTNQTNTPTTPSRSTNTPAPAAAGAPSGGGASAGGAAGPTGTCVCSPSIPVFAIRAGATAEQVREMERRCTTAPANGTFDAENFVCTGRRNGNIQSECEGVARSINQAAGFDVASCVFTPRP